MVRTLIEDLVIIEVTELGVWEYHAFQLESLLAVVLLVVVTSVHRSHGAPPSARPLPVVKLTVSVLALPTVFELELLPEDQVLVDPEEERRSAS